MHKWSDQDLFRPFSQIKANVGPATQESYFDGAFYDFERHVGTDVDWDLPVLVSAAKAHRAGRILDIGCGSGRVARALVHHIPNVHVTGVDASGDALQDARLRGCGAHVLIRSDVVTLADRVDLRHSFDMAVLGSATINSFDNEQTVRALLTTADQVLTRDGRLVVVMFAASELARFERFREFCDGVPFVDREGRDRVILRGIDFDPASRRLRHNYFIPGQPGARCAPGPGALTVHVERVWALDQFGPLVESLGWAYEVFGRANVVGGGADGWTCECVIVRR